MGMIMANNAMCDKVKGTNYNGLLLEEQFPRLLASDNGKSAIVVSILTISTILYASYQ